MPPNRLGVASAMVSMIAVAAALRISVVAIVAKKVISRGAPSGTTARLDSHRAVRTTQSTLTIARHAANTHISAPANHRATINVLTIWIACATSRSEENPSALQSLMRN